MYAVFQYIARRPPRTGWVLFGLALGAIMMLAGLVMSSPMELASAPAALGAVVGLVLGMAGTRWRRALVLLVALLVPLVLLGLVPPPGILANDLVALLTLRGQRPPFLVPAALYQRGTSLALMAQAALAGDQLGLNRAIEALAALLSYAVALGLGIGLRRGARPIVYTLPLLTAIAVVGITVRAGLFQIMLTLFAALLVYIVGDFDRRERTWDSQGVDYSGLLRADVTAVGAAILVGAILLGTLTPSVARNPVTRWIWSGMELPAALERLDSAEGGTGGGGSGGSAVGLGNYGPGQNLELGRSLELGSSEDLALTIRAAGVEPSTMPYWRGRVLDEYSGRAWTTGPLRNVSSAPLVTEQLPPDLLVQQVTDDRPDRQLRYGLPDIVALDTAATIEQDAMGISAGWVGSGTQYTVYSTPPEPLSFEGPIGVDSQRLLENFLVLPEDLPPRVADLAGQITADAGSQTARAEAIERYLRALSYSYEVEPLPAGGDAVDQFLFSMRSGYCTYYASAMAIMARSIGIPSRVAVGYATGEYDAATGSFVVREGDAHAWPELYIDGQGWTRWEPTPIRPIPARSSEPETPRPAVAQPETQPAGTSLAWWPIAALVVVFVLLAVVQVRRLGGPLTPAAVHADLFRIGRRAGVPPRAADSIQEYAARLAGRVPAARQPVELVARLLTARVYRSRPLDGEEERSLLSAWDRARIILRRGRE